MTVTGSLQGGVAMSQWRFNLQHAPNDEFTRLHRMPKEVFSKLVALCKSCYLKYRYCRVERRLRRRARKVKGPRRSGHRKDVVMQTTRVQAFSSSEEETSSGSEEETSDV